MSRRTIRIRSAILVLLLMVGGRAHAEPVKSTDAQELAIGWLSESRTHLSAKMHSRVKAVKTYPYFHVIQLEPEGFIVTAADDELEPVLAFSDRGSLTPDADNPLWVMLNQDLPERTKQLTTAKARHARPGKTPALTDKADETVLGAATQSKTKWNKYRVEAKRPSRLRQPLPQAVAASSPVVVDDGPMTNAPAQPIQITSFAIVDGYVHLTYDARESVSIYASYDGGKTWQVQDTGVVATEWVSKQPAREMAGLYRVERDGIVDGLTVSLMRDPPPLTELPVEMLVATNGTFTAPEAPSLASLGSISDVRVAPLLQSLWDQSSAQGNNCYNYYTPNNYVCGCVATCMAQLMRYWQHPTAPIGQVSRTVYVNGTGQTKTTRGGNGSGGAYDWANMPLNPGASSYNLAQWQQIGSLCFDAGVSVSMMYAPGASGAYMSYCPGAFTGIFKYAGARSVNNPGNNMVLPIDSNLAAGHPVLLGIRGGNNGHAIVCDGFGYDAGTLYHHCNMGWSGSYNYWCALPVVGTPYNFTVVETVIYNVFPTGTGELITGRVLNSAGAPLQGTTITAAAGGQNYTGTTDAKGYYGVKVPANQAYTVTASKAGMANVARSGVTTGNSADGACGNVANIDFTLNNNFSFTGVGLTDHVSLRWTAPTNSGLSNNTVYIRCRTDRYPTSSSDGTEIYTGTAQEYSHTGVDASGTVTNYYTIWGNNGTAYASLGSAGVNARGNADPGTVRLLWTGGGGEVYTWNLRTNGIHKSSAYVLSAMLTPVGYWTPVGFKDIDQDGTSDILWSGAGGEVVYWILNEDGTRKSAARVIPTALTPAGYWTARGFADIDRDGTPDILWTGAGGEVVYWMLNADGTRKSAGRVVPEALSPATYWTPRAFGDLDNDGTADIIWTGAGGEVVYWMLNANGTRKSTGRVIPESLSPATYWTVRGFADIDRDGTRDLLWTGAGGEVVYWMLNANGTRKSAGRVYASNLTPANYWTPRGLKDINGDGTADIIWTGGGGETRYWFLNANGTFASWGNIETATVSPSYWTLRAIGDSGP